MVLYNNRPKRGLVACGVLEARTASATGTEEMEYMTDGDKGLDISRRSMLRTAGGAAGAGLGLASASGTALAGCNGHPKPRDCPTCQEGKGGPTRYLIQHRPPGNPDKCIELCLPEPAAEAHLEQHEHDECGPCPDDSSRNSQQKGRKK